MKRWSFLALCIMGLVFIFFTLYLGPTALGREPSTGRQSGSLGIRQDPPTVLDVAPNEAPNNLDTAITITGTGFEIVLSGTEVLSTPVVSLDGVSLDAVWVSSQTLTATVPWGLDPGVYTATVTNSDGQLGLLPGAFTVTQAIGVWTTDGPYGGTIEALAVSPVISRTAFAIVYRVGLVRTDDGGDSWSVALSDSDARGVTYGLAPSHTLYYWGRSGLWRSADEGLTFELVLEGMIPTFAPDSQDSQRLWMGKDQEILYSTNGGQDWEVRSTGLPSGTWPSWISVDPVTPSTLYVLYVGDQVYKTIDSGLHWTPIGAGIPPARHGARVVVNPFSPDSLLYCGYHGMEAAYRSIDGGDTWAPVTVDYPDDVSITDLAFSPYLSGTVYCSWNAGWHVVGVSVDGGATWSALAPREGRDFALSIALDPAKGLPAYLGGIDAGVKRSYDGGQSWEPATHGIGGLKIVELAPVPGKPEAVYAGAVGAGTFASDNTGHSWQELALPYAGGAVVELDPQQPERIYIHAGHDLFRTEDRGATWENVHLPELWRYVYMETMAVANSEHSIVYAAGRDDEAWLYDKSVGLAFGSDDFGATWQPLPFTVPVSAVADIAVDPTDSQRIYVAAGAWAEMSADAGKGVFRSLDGGETWEKSSQGLGDLPAFSLAIHPDDPLTIYATAWLTSVGRLTVFKSSNGGDVWTPTGLRALWDYPGEWVPSLAIDPLWPDTLYVGAFDGLFQSLDTGLTWTRAAGALGQVSVTSLGIASDEERTILYVGTLGGLAGETRAIAMPDSVWEGADFVSGGVYQQTIVNQPVATTIYLPLVLKGQ